jgi:hypothetical protein
LENDLRRWGIWIGAFEEVPKRVPGCGERPRQPSPSSEPLCNNVIDDGLRITPNEASSELQLCGVSVHSHTTVIRASCGKWWPEPFRFERPGMIIPFARHRRQLRFTDSWGNGVVWFRM